MGESFLIKRVGGGGIRATDAILLVVAPAGSVVTISKGSVTKTDLGHENASDTSKYDYYFFIHQNLFDSVTPWTVTATLGSFVATTSIIIDTAAEYDISIIYRQYLYDNGTQVVAFGGSKETNSSYSFQENRIYTYSNTSKNYSTVGIYTIDKVDLTPYDSLKFLVDYYSQTGGNQAFQVGVATSKGTYPSYATKVNPSRNTSGVVQTITVDLSNISGEYYVAYNGAASTYTYEIYLEKW